MRRLSGTLEQLDPHTLLRALATSVSTGVLTVETESGTLSLHVVGGRVPAASDDELEHAGRVLAGTTGRFTFEPAEPVPQEGITLPLDAFAEAARSWLERRRSGPPSELDLDRLMEGNLIDFSATGPQRNIHVLPAAPIDNPLDDLLSDLETTAPQELLFAEIAVVSPDPRPWRGSTELEWRRRGWRLRHCTSPTDVPLDEADVVVVHHRLAMTRVGAEAEWLGLIHAARTVVPAVPVVWVGPLGDPRWTQQLVQAGVAFLLPAPQGESGETMSRHLDSLAVVIDRQLATRQVSRGQEIPDSAAALVEAMLHEVDDEELVGYLLQLAARSMLRGAILQVEETAVRCRAGFGYPLVRGGGALPRGMGFIERVIRGAETAREVEPDSAGAIQLARILGLDRLPAATAVIPLGQQGRVAGLLVADREGQELPELDELILLVGRLGGAMLRTSR